MKPTLVILAAGMGSRYGGLKQIDGVGPNNETIIDYSIFDSIRAGFGEIVFIIRKDIEAAFRDRFEAIRPKDISFQYVFQELDSFVNYDGTIDRTKPWGTGHAVLVAKDVVRTPFAVINADDYYGRDAFAIMAKWLTTSCSPEHYAMMGYSLSHTLSEYGSVSRGVCALDDRGYLARIDERTQVQWSGREVVYMEGDQAMPLDLYSSVSMNFWGFHPSLFDPLMKRFQQFVAENVDHPKSEFFIPLFIQEWMDAGFLRVSVLPCHDRWYGVTYKEDKPIVQQAFLQMTERGDYPVPLW